MPICKLNHVKDVISDGQRLLGLDIGKKTIGLALSDKSLAIASPVKILWRSKFTLDVNSIFDFTPKSISTDLNLLRPIYSSTAAGGHFGRTPGVEGEFPWEKLDQAKLSALRN